MRKTKYKLTIINLASVRSLLQKKLCIHNNPTLSYYIWINKNQQKNIIYITAEDIEFRMKEYLDMNVPPFEVKELKVQQ